MNCHSENFYILILRRIYSFNDSSSNVFASSLRAILLKQSLLLREKKELFASSHDLLAMTKED